MASEQGLLTAFSAWSITTERMFAAVMMSVAGQTTVIVCSCPPYVDVLLPHMSSFVSSISFSTEKKTGLCGFLTSVVHLCCITVTVLLLFISLKESHEIASIYWQAVLQKAEGCGRGDMHA